MKPTIDLSSVKSDITLPKKDIEVVANYDWMTHGIFKNKFQLADCENTSWCFLHALGTGNVQLNSRNRHSNSSTQWQIPVIASFMAVCTKAGSGRYKLQYCVSMS